MDVKQRVDIATKICDKLIKDYDTLASQMRTRNNIHQTLVVVATGATSVIAAVEGLPKWALVLPAVIASMAGSFITVFRFRDKFVNFVITHERLVLAKTRFQLLSGPDPEPAIKNLLDEMKVILESARGEWRELHQAAPQHASVRKLGD